MSVSESTGEPVPSITSSRRSKDWLVVPSRRPHAQGLVICIPHAGGGRNPYSTWAAMMPSELELSVVVLPGREARLTESPCTSVDEIIEQLVPVLSSSTDRPVALFGHSMGALIAFELARALDTNTRGTCPMHLFVSGSVAPQVRRSSDELRGLDNDALVDAVAERYGGFAPAVLSNTDLRQYLGLVLRADFTLLDAYRYTQRSPLACPLTVFAGRQDPLLDESGVAAWKAHTLGEFSVEWLAAQHFFDRPTTTYVVAEIARRVLATIRR